MTTALEVQQAREAFREAVLASDIARTYLEWRRAYAEHREESIAAEGERSANGWGRAGGAATPEPNFLKDVEAILNQPEDC